MTCTTKVLPVAEQEVRLYCKTSNNRFTSAQDSTSPWGFGKRILCIVGTTNVLSTTTKRDINYVDPGWYERIHNWPDYGAAKIYDEVLDWSPLEQLPLRWRPKINEVVRVKQILSGGNFFVGEKVRIIGVFMNNDTFQAVPVDRPQDIFPYCLTIDEIEPLESKWERAPSNVNKSDNEEKKDFNFLTRLTTNRSWDEAQKDLVNEMGYSYLWNRLNQIENILGSAYSLKELEQVWKERYKRWLLNHLYFIMFYSLLTFGPI